MRNPITARIVENFFKREVLPKQTFPLGLYEYWGEEGSYSWYKYEDWKNWDLNERLRRK